jgi:hypothetical protein
MLLLIPILPIAPRAGLAPLSKNRLCGLISQLGIRLQQEVHVALRRPGRSTELRCYDVQSLVCCMKKDCIGVLNALYAFDVGFMH